MLLKFTLVCTIISLSISFVQLKRATTLPEYIPKCTFDETFNDCFKNTGNEVIPKIINGDKPFGIPSFNPFRLDEVIFEPTNNLKMHFTNLNVSGFEETKIIKVELNKAKNEIYFEITIPKVDIIADYETSGRILVLPFEGKGPCKIILVDGAYKISTKFENMDQDSKGKLKLVQVDVDYTLGKTIYNFENLFNGNKRIGDETNRFLNENNADLYKDFKPAFSKTIETIVFSVINAVLGNLHTTSVFKYV